MNNSKIRIAFIKYDGMSAGGTEKFMQTIAANLPKDIFDVTFFYNIPEPSLKSSLHKERIIYCKNNGVTLVQFRVESINFSSPNHDWVNTDFWNFFDEDDFDIVQSARAGHPEYPFTKIRKVPIVDSVHILGGIDNQPNIKYVMLLNEWSKKLWVSMKGNGNKAVIVSHPIDMHESPNLDLFKKFTKNYEIIFGFHQRNEDNIFSEMPLAAYKSIETDQTAFLLLGGSKRYSEQAHQLKIKNFYQFAFTSDGQIINSFLSTLDIFAHGRYDGEVNSTAMAEAMYFGLPIVSHTSTINNGHVESIGDAGFVVNALPEYINILHKLSSNYDLRNNISRISRKRFADYYSKEAQILKICDIYFETLHNKKYNFQNLKYNLRYYRRNIILFLFQFFKNFKKIF